MQELARNMLKLLAKQCIDSVLLFGTGWWGNKQAVSAYTFFQNKTELSSKYYILYLTLHSVYFVAEEKIV